MVDGEYFGFMLPFFYIFVN